MKLTIRFQHLDPSPALRQHAARRARFRLGRFAAAVDTVAIRFADLNGPKGGLDKGCRITVIAKQLAPISVEERGSDPYGAADAALERAARALRRSLDRASLPVRSH